MVLPDRHKRWDGRQRVRAGGLTDGEDATVLCEKRGSGEVDAVDHLDGYEHVVVMNNRDAVAVGVANDHHQCILVHLYIVTL